MTLIMSTIAITSLTPIWGILGVLALLALLGAVEAFPTEEFRKGLGEIKTGVGAHQQQIAGLESAVQGLQEQQARTRTDLDRARRQLAGQPSGGSNQRRPGGVTPECAQWIGAAFVLGNARSGRLDLLEPAVRDR